MGEYFNPWRRKAACVTLVMAGVLTLSWIRSLQIEEFASVPVGGTPILIGHVRGRAIGNVLNKNLTSWGFLTSSVDQFERFPYWEFTDESIVLPHSAIIIPLTVLSAVLLFWPIRRRHPA